MGKGFFFSRDRHKINSLVETKSAVRRGTGHLKVMFDLLIYKHVMGEFFYFSNYDRIGISQLKMVKTLHKTMSFSSLLFLSIFTTNPDFWQCIRLYPNPAIV